MIYNKEIILIITIITLKKKLDLRERNALKSKKKTISNFFLRVKSLRVRKLLILNVCIILLSEVGAKMSCV